MFQVEITMSNGAIAAVILLLSILMVLVAFYLVMKEPSTKCFSSSQVHVVNGKVVKESEKEEGTPADPMDIAGQLGPSGTRLPLGLDSTRCTARPSR